MNKSSYETLRETCALNLPHPNTRHKITREMKIHPGYDPSIYFTIRDQILSSSDIMGHLMLDEIRLENGLAWDCMNNEVTGLI